MLNYWQLKPGREGYGLVISGKPGGKQDDSDGISDWIILAENTFKPSGLWLITILGWGYIWYLTTGG